MDPLANKREVAEQFGATHSAADAVQAQQLVDELITTRYRLDEVNQGYRDLLDGRNIRGLLVHDH